MLAGIGEAAEDAWENLAKGLDDAWDDISGGIKMPTIPIAVRCVRQ